MPQKRRFHGNKPKKRHDRAAAPPTMSAVPVPYEKKVPVVYGKPFTLLEDEQKNTFEYKAGSWVQFTMSIAECREQCQVNELPQKVNRMTRYEIRYPVAAAT